MYLLLLYHCLFLFSYTFCPELAGMAAERVDDGLVAINRNGGQRKDAGIHTNILNTKKIL